MDDFRVAAKLMPAVKIADHEETARSYLVRGDGRPSSQHISLITLRASFNLLDTEVREPELEAARIRTELALSEYGRWEDDLLISGPLHRPNPGPVRGVTIQFGPLPHNLHCLRMIVPVAVRAGAPQDYVTAIRAAAARVVRSTGPQATALIANSELLDRLNEPMAPAYAESPLDQIERSERLRLQEIESSDFVPPGTAIILPLSVGAQEEELASNQIAMFERVVAAGPEIKFAGWAGDQLQFAIVSTFALRIKYREAAAAVCFRP
jgi:hypothetical protein